MIFKENKVDGLTLPECRSYYKGTAVNSVLSWHEDKHVVNGIVFSLSFLFFVCSGFCLFVCLFLFIYFILFLCVRTMFPGLTSFANLRLFLEEDCH